MSAPSWPPLTTAGQRAVRDARRDQLELATAVVWDQHPDDPGPEEPAGGPEDEASPRTPEQRAEYEVQHATRRLRTEREARRRLDAENAPTLRVLGFADFVAAPTPTALVPNLFYRDSLSRIFGPPGCGKSFLMLDIALRVALGMAWSGMDVPAGHVYYVMAEGQAVNVDRTLAWLDHHAVTDMTPLEERFHAVPEAVLLTEGGAAEFIDQLAQTGAALVVIDTKNACQVGEENSSSDFAVMRRVLDQVRRAAGGACVVLVDHTGYEATRARGTSAGEAAMDTEIRVSSDPSIRPLPITLRVTRDKAAEPGFTRDFVLQPHADAAVPVPASRPDQEQAEPRERRQVADVELPADVLGYEGNGAKAVLDLARLMASEGADDPHGIGTTRLEAQREMKGAGHSESTHRRAWSVLIERGHLVRAKGVTTDTGRHLWALSPGLSAESCDSPLTASVTALADNP